MKPLLIILGLLIPELLLGQSFDYLGVFRGTYCGHSNTNVSFHVSDMVTDAQGFVYICGNTQQFPTTAGAYIVSNSPPTKQTGFVCKLSPNLSTIIWATYIGGSTNSNTYSSAVMSLSVNSNGEVFIKSISNDATFPLSDNSDQTYLNNGSWVYVSKLNSTGSQLLYSRLIGYGGAGWSGFASHYKSTGREIALNSAGEAFVITPLYPSSGSTNLMRVSANGYQTTRAGGYDVGLTKISSSGTIDYCTYVGGSGNEGVSSCVYAGTTLYITGITTSSNFPLATNRTPDAAGDCFVMAWNDGSTPSPSATYIFGGSAEDWCKELRYNSAINKLIVDGYSSSSDFPLTQVLQSGQTTGGFVAALNPDLSGMTFCTMIGNNLRPCAVRTRPNGDIYVVSTLKTSTATAPITPFAFKSTNTGINDMALVGLTPTGALRYGSFIGGCAGSTDGLYRNTAYLELIESGSCPFKAVIGTVGVASLFPTTAGAYQQIHPGGGAAGVCILQTYHPDTLKATPTPTCGEYLFEGTTSGRDLCPALNTVWNFGDGTATQSGNPVTHKYARNGVFTVVMRVAYSGGDTSTFDKTITVQSQPVVVTSPHVAYRCSKDAGVNLSVSGAVRYEWHPGATLSDSTVSNPRAKPTVNTIYTVRGYDANGCFADDSVQVYVTRVAARVSTIDTIICKGGTVSITASGGGAFKWSPSLGLSSTTSATVLATVNTDSDYRVIVSDGSCADTATVHIGLANAPRLSLDQAPVLCLGDSVTLEAKVSGTVRDTAGVRFVWSPATGLSATTVPTPIAKPLKTTTYYCTATNTYGCLVRDSLTVKVQSALKITTLFRDTLTCVGSSIALGASGGARYQWSPATFLDNPSSPMPRCTPNRDIRYTVVSTSGSCIDSAYVDVHVVSVPALKIQLSDSVVCPGSAVTISLDTSADTFRYEWRNDSGSVVGTTSTLLVHPATTTTYTIKATSVFGCTLEDSVRVLVNPTLSVQALGGGTVTSGTVVTLSVRNPQSTIQYVWRDTSGAIISHHDTVSVVVTQSTRYFVYAVRGGCEGVDSVLVSVRSNVYVPVKASADTSICEGSTAVLRVIQSADSSLFTWIDSRGNVISDSLSVAVTPASDERYVVIASNGLQRSSDTVQVTVFHAPHLTTHDTTVCEGEEVRCMVESDQTEVIYKWRLQDGTYVGSSQFVTLQPDRSSQLKVNVTNAVGCTAAATININVRPHVQLTLSTVSIDSAHVGSIVDIPLSAQADRTLGSGTIRFRLRIAASMLQLDGARYDDGDVIVEDSVNVTLTTSMNEIARYKAQVLATQQRFASWKIEILESRFDSVCTSIVTRGGRMNILSVCSNDLLRMQLGDGVCVVAPNPVDGDVVSIISNADVEDVQLWSQSGDLLTTDVTRNVDQRGDHQQPRAGSHCVSLRCAGLSNGMYVVRVRINGIVFSRCIVLIR